MKPNYAIALIFSVVTLAFSAIAQNEGAWEVQALSQVLPGTIEGKVDYDLAAGTATGKDGVFIRYGNAVLTADTAKLNTKTGDVQADGNVRIESGDQLWVGW